MVASDSFAEFLREQLAPLGRVTMRRMFGKTGVFCDGLMFGMVTDNTLYFRVDDHNRAAFRKPRSFRLSATRRRAAPLTSPFGALRSGYSTNPMSLSRGREQQWRRRVASPRRENGRRQAENQSLNQREGGMDPPAGTGIALRRVTLAHACPAPPFEGKSVARNGFEPLTSRLSARQGP